MAKIEMRKCDNCNKRTDYPELTAGWVTLVGANKKVTVYGHKGTAIAKPLSSHLDACSKECLVKILFDPPKERD